MATIYMEVIPKVEPGGSVTAEGYKGWMELTGLTKTVERAIKQSAEQATNREAAHPQIQPFGCTRQADVATPGMFAWSVGGKPRKVKIHLCMPGDQGKPMRLLVQAVGARVRHQYDRPWKPDEERRSRLVVIAEHDDIDADAIRGILTGVTEAAE